MATQVYTAGTTDRGLLLRRALQGDAIFGAVSGIVLTLMSGALAPLLGMPATMLLVIGLILLPYAAWLWFQATRPVISRRVAWAVIGLNALWVVESIALLVFGWLPLTTAGWWAVVGTALLVATFGELQFFGLRRSR